MGINSIRAVVFDVGGVLIQNHDRNGRRKWETQLDLPEHGLSRLVFASDVAQQAMIGRATEDEVWNYVARLFKLDPEQLKCLRTDFWVGEELDTTLVQFLRDLRPRYKTGILSNAFGTARQALTENFKLGDAVDTMVFSAEEKLKKPDPRIYHIALQRLDVPPEQTIFVDDLAENIQAARWIGMQGVHFKGTRQVIDEVKKYLE